MAQLVLDRVGKSFGHTQVVESFSLDVPSGSFVALLGPSGCGKTTILRMLAGFEQISQGSIHVGGRQLAGQNLHVPPDQRNMSMVFQSYALWPHMNVMDNAGYALKLRGIKGEDYRQQVMQALETVNLAHLAERAPQDLSGGQRQRVALARCLVSHPDVVLLDEPLANLDQHLRASMEETFREFHRRTGATFVYVTHDQAEAMALADRIAVMNHGRLEQWDTPEQLYQYPQNTWVARFIGQGSILYVHRNTDNRILSGAEVMQLLSSSLGSTRQAILVRPEHVRVVENGLEVQVLSRVFKGERYKYTARLQDGQELDFYHHERLDIERKVCVALQQAWALLD
ncbi:ABC transporter ATP-binding protein [Advenella sp. RU8]|uniref:ABC transporter ATP-binding protein n=1 Tax=Advenella sp. RU8 TaxID=3399575 RepID=UPI003AADBB87